MIASFLDKNLASNVYPSEVSDFSCAASLTRSLSGFHMSPKQILTCSSILANTSAESTPMGGYLSSVFSRVVT